MPKLTIGRMAKLYGLHRSTLHEAVAKGRVTAGLDGKGQKVIDLSEMIRVYGEPTEEPLHHPTPAPDTHPTLSEHVLQPLLEELRLLRDEVKELRMAMALIEHKPTPSATSPTSSKSGTSAATWSDLLKSLSD